MPISTCSTTLCPVRVLVLDRIFDRHDVLGIPPVDHVYERRQRGGLTGAGWAADEDEAVRELRQRLDPFRQAQLGQLRRTSEGSARMLAAARPRSRCRLMRNRPRPLRRSEASAMP